MTVVKQLNEVLVYPSPRISERVPFGTGPSVKKIIAGNTYPVYNFQLFLLLKDFFDGFGDCYESVQLSKIPVEIILFTGEENIIRLIAACRNHSSSKANFIKRMFTVFDAFFVVKFLNSYANGSAFPPVELKEAALDLLKHIAPGRDYTNEDLYQTLLDIDLKNLSPLHQSGVAGGDEGD
jgi:hypothetical protein